MKPAAVKGLTWIVVTIISIIIWTLVLTAVFGCAICPKATPENVQKWERKKKFTALSDSCLKVWKLSASRKY
jgi:hypothetical protein